MADLDGEHDQDDRGQMDDEGVEGEAGGRADQDIGRIADQGRRAADIGAQHLAEEEGEGRQLELIGDDEGDRRDQQHRRHIVQSGGERRR